MPAWVTDMTVAEFTFWLLVVTFVIPCILAYLLNPGFKCKHDFEHIDDKPNLRMFECRICKKRVCKKTQRDAEGKLVIIDEPESQ